MSAYLSYCNVSSSDDQHLNPLIDEELVDHLTTKDCIKSYCLNLIHSYFQKFFPDSTYECLLPYLAMFSWYMSLSHSL